MPPPPPGHLSPDLAESLDKSNTPKLTSALLKRIGSYLKPYVRSLIAATVIIIVSSALNVVPALLTGEIIDKSLIAGDFDMLVRLVLMSLVLVILSNALGLLETYINATIAQGVSRDMKNQMYSHLQIMSYRFFTNTRQGDIITRLTEDITGVRTVVTQALSSSLKNICTILVTLVALFETNWVLALCGVAVLPLFMTPTKLTGRRRWRIARSIQKESDKSNQILNETLSVSGQLLTKLFGKEKDEYEKYKKINDEVYRLSVKETLTGRMFFATIAIFSNLSPLVIYLAGGILMMKTNISPDLTIGEITAVVTLLTRLHRPLDELLNINVDLTRSLALFERIFEYFDIEPEIKDREGCIDVGRLRGEVSYERVSFAYREDKPVLEDIDFRIKPGSAFAIVGSSGAGKSTLITLLPRLYDVTAGAVKIDGIDIRDMSMASLRKNIGMVSQDTFLFNASIYDNLLYANPDATEEQIVEACKKASIHDFIAALPDGYDTMVGNRGLRLSGGEKQRISIARVILKDPPIIILDEATSSLDSISESHIQSAIRPLLRDRTSLVVAHRLSTIMSSDEIAVVKDRRITARGTHDQLLQSSPEYREFFETQFKLPKSKEGKAS